MVAVPLEHSDVEPVEVLVKVGKVYTVGKLAVLLLTGEILQLGDTSVLAIPVIVMV